MRARRSVAQMVRVPLSAADWMTEVKSSILPVVSGYWGRRQGVEDVLEDMEEEVMVIMKENEYLEDDSTNILAREVDLVDVHHLSDNDDDDDAMAPVARTMKMTGRPKLRRIKMWPPLWRYRRARPWSRHS